MSGVLDKINMMGIWEHKGGFFICSMISDNVAKKNKGCFFYVLYFEKTWVFDQEGHAQGPIYIKIIISISVVWGGNSYMPRSPGESNSGPRPGLGVNTILHLGRGHHILRQCYPPCTSLYLSINLHLKLLNTVGMSGLNYFNQGREGTCNRGLKKIKICFVFLTAKWHDVLFYSWWIKKPSSL